MFYMVYQDIHKVPEYIFVGRAIACTSGINLNLYYGMC